MQTLKNATAAFCLACVCAEIAAQLVGGGWPRRCIKAAAGLYILVVLLRAVPDAREQLTSFSVPTLDAENYGTVEQSVLSEAQAQLEQALAAQCLAETGVAVRLQITLVRSGASVSAASVRAVLPAGCTEADAARAAAFLRQALGTEPELAAGEGGA